MGCADQQRVFVCSLMRPTSPFAIRVHLRLKLVHFEIIGTIADVETIAAGRVIRELLRLQEQFRKGRWRKLKGIASIRLSDGTIRMAEVHWYEAHGIGKRNQKIKRFLD
jgi:hypothetical protein